MARLVSFAVLLLSSGCLVDRIDDAEGHACEAPTDCPSPFICFEGACRRSDDGGVPVKDSYVVVAAGNIACDPADPDFAAGNGTSKVCRMRDTAELAREAAPDAVLALGNLQLSDGSAEKFRRSYALHWGSSPLRERTFPVPGPAEYGTAGAGGFFETFPELTTRAEGRGYYAFTLGNWRVLALNSACSEPSVGGCGQTSPQGRWLAAELGAATEPCLLAYMQAARFSSTGGSEEVLPLWQQLHAAGVDVVLSGGALHYERFAPLTPDGVLAAARGVRSFVVGTGGVRLGDVSPAAAHSERVGASHGVLRLSLEGNGYAWRYLAVGDVPLSDSGSASCHE